MREITEEQLRQVINYELDIDKFSHDDIRTLLHEVFDLRKENLRLISGDFTEEEFQNLCHKFNDGDVIRFCDGCENYQIKLFGKSPITELKNKVNELKLDNDILLDYKFKYDSCSK